MTEIGDIVSWNEIIRKEERERIVGIINGKFRKAFPDLAKQLVEEIEKK
jgi:hypothetical protein